MNYNIHPGAAELLIQPKDTKRQDAMANAIAKSTQQDVIAAEWGPVEQ